MLANGAGGKDKGTEPAHILTYSLASCATVFTAVAVTAARPKHDPRNYPGIPRYRRPAGYHMRNTWYRTRTYPRERQSYQRDEPSSPPMKLLLRGLSAIMVGLASEFGGLGGRALFVDGAGSICPACECDGAFCECDGLGGGL